MKLTTISERIPPVRGLVTLHTARGARLALVDVRRWVRVNRQVFRAEKIDLLDGGAVSACWPDLLACAEEAGVRVSLRTNCGAAPGDLAGLAKDGLLDVFLCPPSVASEHLEAWFDACGQAGLPMRLQVQAPFDPGLDVAAWADRAAAAGVAAVNVALFDPFLDLPPCRDQAEGQATVAQMNALVTALAAKGVEANVIGLPLCLVEERNLAHAVNRRQFFLDHQQYVQRAYELGAALYRRGPARARIALTMIQSRYTLLKNPIDAKLLPWIINHPRSMRG